MKVTLISSTQVPGLVCGEAAAVCTKSKNPLSALHHSVESGHTSILEHASFTFRIEDISRVTLAQLTRHRIASFSVQSQRYVKMVDPDIIIPDSVKDSKYADEAAELIERSVELYNKLTGAEVPCEDARYLLPMGSPTTLIMTMNVRELLHFFSLRCCNRAQWEIRDLADAMLSICLEQWPDIFKDAGPGCVTGKCPEKRPCGHPRNNERIIEKI